MSLEQLMNNCLTLNRPTIVAGSSGAQAPSLFTPDAQAIGVPCSIQPAGASKITQYMQRRMQVSHEIYFDYNWQPFLGDRWAEEGSGRYFVVMGWYESLEIKDTWTCPCQEIRVPLSPGVPTP